MAVVMAALATVLVVVCLAAMTVMTGAAGATKVESGHSDGDGYSGCKVMITAVMQQLWRPWLWGWMVARVTAAVMLVDTVAVATVMMDHGYGDGGHDGGYDGDSGHGVW